MVIDVRFSASNLIDGQRATLYCQPRANRAIADATAPIPNEVSCHQNSRQDNSPKTFVSKRSSAGTGSLRSRRRAICAVALKSRSRLMLHQRANTIDTINEKNASPPRKSTSHDGREPERNLSDKNASSPVASPRTTLEVNVKCSRVTDCHRMKLSDGLLLINIWVQYLGSGP